MKKFDWREYNKAYDFLPKQHIIRLGTESFRRETKEKAKEFASKKVPLLEPITLFSPKKLDTIEYRSFHFVDNIRLGKLEETIFKKQKSIIDYIGMVGECKNVAQDSISNGSNLTNFLELKKVFIHPKPTFDEVFKEKFFIGAEFKFRRKIDISKFYDSIYTHSFSWIDTSTKLDEKFWGKIDEGNKNINGRMTKGIATGPLTSKIASELLMTHLMLKIEEKISGEKNWFIRVYRFIDDFTVFYNNEETFLSFFSYFIGLLNEFKLSINIEKLKDDRQQSIFQPYKTKVNYNDEDRYLEWSVEINGIIQNQEPINSKDVNKFIKGWIISTIKSMNRQDITQFYIYILKTLKDKKEILIDFLKDGDCARLLWNICINSFTLTEKNLNVVNEFLIETVNLIDPLLCKNALNELFFKLKQMYESTSSEMKKIFLFELFLVIDWSSKIDTEAVNVTINSNQIIHTTQILESGLFEKNKENIIKSHKKPIFITKHKRLTKEWVVWLYCEEENTYFSDDKKSDETMRYLIQNRDFLKPFHYNTKNLLEKGIFSYLVLST